MKKCLAGFRITSQFLSAPSRRWAKRRSVFQLRVSDYMLDIVSLHHRLQPAWQTLRLSKRSSSVLMKISRQCSSDMLSCTGTRVKAWTRWSSPKQKATHKILCMYILNLLPSDVAHVYLSFSAEYQQVYNFLYEEHTYSWADVWSLASGCREFSDYDEGVEMGRRLVINQVPFVKI